MPKRDSPDGEDGEGRRRIVRATTSGKMTDEKERMNVSKEEKPALWALFAEKSIRLEVRDHDGLRSPPCALFVGLPSCIRRLTLRAACSKWMRRHSWRSSQRSSVASLCFSGTVMMCGALCWRLI